MNGKAHIQLRRSPTLGILVMLLGLAVFGWGLHYKLSLYQPPTASSARQPAARLLSEQQRTGVQAGDTANPDAHPLVDTPPLPGTLALLVISLLLLAPPLWTLSSRWGRDRYVRFHARTLLGPLFRRPPPFLFFR
ncbi:MAG TPA: hypothetical protein VGD62_00335 [Acidobacteriaceae bacterium]